MWQRCLHDICYFEPEPHWDGHFKLSCCMGYKCLWKPKSVCLTGWPSEGPWRTLTSPLCCYHPFLVFSPSVSTEIIRAERINIHDISTNSATVQWRPVLSGLRGYYEVRFGPQVTQVPGGGGGSETGTSPSTGGSQYQRLVQPADSSTARLTGLKPDTTYTVTLIPESNEHSFNALTATFTTKPG